MRFTATKNGGSHIRTYSDVDEGFRVIYSLWLEGYDIRLDPRFILGENQLVAEFDVEGELLSLRSRLPRRVEGDSFSPIVK
jgi:hypothetical protein